MHLFAKEMTYVTLLTLQLIDRYLLTIEMTFLILILMDSDGLPYLVDLGH
jgi:hypothetical protein